MYHIKELMNPNSAIPDIASEVEAEREMPILSKIRFGELEVGDKFVFDGFWLVKTSEYHAESDKKRGKSHYLFFKKDIVKREHQDDIAEKPGLTKKGSGKGLSVDTLDGAHASDLCDLIDHRPSFRPFNKDCKKYDLFDGHDGIIKPYENRQCEISITPGTYDVHHIVVTEGDYKWSTDINTVLDRNWDVPIKLKDFELNLRHCNQVIQLFHGNEMVWSRPFEQGWAGINTCTITIKNIRLER